MEVIVGYNRSNSLISEYYSKVARSKTYVGETKAVRLAGLRNTTIRKDGDDFVFRLHNTDIVRITPGRVATISTDGWRTPTTFNRIFQITGVGVSNNSRLVSKYKTRIFSRECRHSLPFVDGVRVHLPTGEITNPEVIPADVREERFDITKKARTEFRKLWKPIASTAKMVMAMRLVHDAVMRDKQSNGLVSTWAYQSSVVKAFDKLLNDPCAEDVINALRAVSMTVMWNPSERQIDDVLSGAVERLRKRFQEYWANLDHSNRKTLVGGYPLGEGYYSGGKHD